MQVPALASRKLRDCAQGGGRLGSLSRFPNMGAGHGSQVEVQRSEEGALAKVLDERRHATCVIGMGMGQEHEIRLDAEIQQDVQRRTPCLSTTLAQERVDDHPSGRLTGNAHQRALPKARAEQEHLKLIGREPAERRHVSW